MLSKSRAGGQLEDLVCASVKTIYMGKKVGTPPSPQFGFSITCVGLGGDPPEEAVPAPSQLPWPWDTLLLGEKVVKYYMLCESFLHLCKGFY